MPIAKKKKSTSLKMNKWRKSPLPWIVFMGILLGVSFYFTNPIYTEWQKDRTALKTLKPDIAELEKEITQKEGVLTEIRNEFEGKAAESRERDVQIFPEKIDLSKIAKILELYGVLLEYGSEGDSFSLDSINFVQQATPKKGATHTITKATIRVTGSSEAVKFFMKFLKTGIIPKVVTKDAGELADLLLEKEFLKTNLLPVATIESVHVTEKEQDEFDDTKLTVADITVNFYSQ